jgi:hypothetical protein
MQQSIPLSRIDPCRISLAFTFNKEQSVVLSAFDTIITFHDMP